MRVGCPSATRSTHGPPVGVRGAGGPTRGQVACLVCVSVPECHQIDARPARGCAGCWLAYPWAGGLPGVRAGAGCCGVPAREPVAVLVGVPVPVCHQIDTRPARGCAGCWRAYPVGRWPAWRACRVPVGGARGQGAYLVAVPVLAGLPVGPCACRVPVGVRLPLSRWPRWWACRCPCATRSTHGPPVGVRGAGGPTPWAGGLPRGQRQPVPW